MIIIVRDHVTAILRYMNRVATKQCIRADVQCCRRFMPSLHRRVREHCRNRVKHIWDGVNNGTCQLVVTQHRINYLFN